MRRLQDGREGVRDMKVEAQHRDQPARLASPRTRHAHRGPVIPADRNHLPGVLRIRRSVLGDFGIVAAGVLIAGLIHAADSLRQRAYGVGTVGSA